MKHFRTHHIAFTVADLEASTSWYENKLGFTPEHQSGPPEHSRKMALLTNTADATHVELFEADKGSKIPEERTDIDSDVSVIGTKHLCLQTRDLDAALDELATKDVEVANHPEEAYFGGRYAFIKDLDGNLIEIYEQTEKPMFLKVSSEALENPIMLNTLKVLKVELARMPTATNHKLWHQFFIEVPRDIADSVASEISAIIKNDWYSVLYDEQRVIVIMKNRLFELERESPWDSEEYQKMRIHAMNQGVEEEFLDFNERFIEFDAWMEEFA